MTLRPADRRRLVFASVLTAVVFPAVWWENQEDGSSNRPHVAAVGLPAEDPAVATTLPVAPAPPEPAFLAAEPSPLSIPPGATLLVGRADDDLVATTEAVFDNRIDRGDVCWFGGITEGEVITVVNRANGQSLECRVVGRDDADPTLVVLGPGAFATLADFPDAPIHVEVRR